MPHLTPAYITVDPVTGDVGANFPGGVTITAAESGTAPTSRRVRWVSALNGAEVAEIFAANFDTAAPWANVVEFALLAEAFNALDYTTVEMDVVDAADIERGFLLLEYDPTGTIRPAGAKVSLIAGVTTDPGTSFVGSDTTPVIINSAGCSDLVISNAASKFSQVVRILNGGLVAVAGLAAGAVQNSAGVSTGLDSTYGNLSLQSLRVFGGFSAAGGSQLGWGWSNLILGNPSTISIQFRNLDTLAFAGGNFAPVYMGVYG